MLKQMGAIACLLVGLLTLGQAFAEEDFDLAAFRVLAASDRAAGIEEGRKALDSGRFQDAPVTERQALWYMGGAAIGMPDDVALSEIALRLDSLGRARGDEVALAYSDFLRGSREIDLGREGEGLALVLRGANRIGLHEDPNMRAIAAAELCRAFGGAGKPEQAAEHCQRYTDAARSLGDESQLARAEYLQASNLSWLGHQLESIPLWQAARDRYNKLDQPVLAARATGSLAGDLVEIGQHAEALAYAREAQQAGEAAGNPISAYMAQMTAAQALFALGRLDEARRDIDTATAGIRAIERPDLLRQALGLQEQLALAEGNVTQAQAIAAERDSLKSDPIQAELNLTIDALEQRYLAREQALRIRELEQENAAKANALERSRIEAEARESSLRAQRTTLLLTALACVALAVALVAIALLLRSQKRLAEGLRRHAYEDALTGVGNRRALFEAVAGVLAGGMREHALILIDVDYFKQINDTGGHPFGDHILLTLGQVLQKASHGQASVYRYGGEEFALLCPDCDEAAALELAERLRSAVRGLTFDQDGRTTRVTISLGVCPLSRSPAPEPSVWVQTADRALYEAKTGGRDRVILAHSAMPSSAFPIAPNPPEG